MTSPSTEGGSTSVRDAYTTTQEEEDQLRWLIASPDSARANIFDHDLTAMQVHKSSLTLDRPVYVDHSVLHLSDHLKYALMSSILETGSKT